MATRFYIKSTGSTDITPSISASWERNGSSSRRAVAVKSKASTASATVDETANFQWLSGAQNFLLQVIYGPLSAQTISGTVGSNFKYSENSTISLNSTIGVRIIKPDETTRYTLLALSDDAGVIDGTTYVSEETGTSGLTSNDSTAGDYLVIEIGLSNNSGFDVLRDWVYGLKIGDDAGSDLVGDGDTTGDPWIEFSDDITSWAPAGLTYGSLTVNVIKDAMAPNNDPSSTGGPISDYGTQTGSIPPGTSLSSTTGRISGTPTTVGTYAFTIRGTGLEGQYDDSPTITYNIYEVPAGLTYSSMSTRAKRGKAITNNTPSSTGGAIASYAIQTGSLPPGLSIHATTGVISGIPTLTGTYTFTVRATGPYGETTDSATITYVIFAGNSLDVFSLAKVEVSIG